jgi:hypothetical protein
MNRPIDQMITPAFSYFRQSPVLLFMFTLRLAAQMLVMPQDGISAFTNASKHGQVLSFTTPPKPRVLDYLRTFAPLAKVDVMQ